MLHDQMNTDDSDANLITSIQFVQHPAFRLLVTHAMSGMRLVLKRIHPSFTKLKPVPQCVEVERGDRTVQKRTDVSIARIYRKGFVAYSALSVAGTLMWRRIFPSSPPRISTAALMYLASTLASLGSIHEIILNLCRIPG